MAPQNVNAVVKAAFVLHNMLQNQSNATQTRRILEDAPNVADAEGLRLLIGLGARPGRDAPDIRDTYKQFFVQDNSVPWQNAHIRRGSFIQ